MITNEIITSKNLKNMKNLVIIVLIAISGSLFSQTVQDSIEIKKSFFGTMYKYKKDYLTPAKIEKTVKENPEALKEIKYARGNKMFGDIFSIFGGFAVGYPIGTQIGGGKPNWNLAIGGAVLTAISIPFYIAYTKHADKAVRIYNEGIRQTTQVNKLNFELGYTPDGIGVRVKF